MPPSSEQKQPHVVNADESIKPHDGAQDEPKLPATETWLFKVHQQRYSPYRIHVTKPDKTRKIFRDYYQAAFYVNMSRYALQKRLDENRFIEFFVWPDDFNWGYDLGILCVSPGDILEFTTSRGSSRPYPVEIRTINKTFPEWYDSMGDAERYIGVYKGWLSKLSKQNHGNPFQRRVTPWMELEPCDESLSANTTITPPCRRELELGSDPETGSLLLFIKERNSLLRHVYAVVKGKSENGKTPFMVLNTTAWRCRMYECATEVAGDMGITEDVFEKLLLKSDAEGVLWLNGPEISMSQCRRSNFEDLENMSIKSPVRKFHVDPKVMILEYQTNSLAESNFEEVTITTGTPGKTDIKGKVELEHKVEVIASAESKVDSEVESSGTEFEVRVFRPEAQIGATSLFVDDFRRGSIHGLSKYLDSRYEYFLVKGKPKDGRTPFMGLNSTLQTCRMYECASEVAADMRITEKEFERLVRLFYEDGEGFWVLPSGINFCRVRENWEFDTTKKMGIKSPIRKYYGDVEDMSCDYQNNSLEGSFFHG